MQHEKLARGLARHLVRRINQEWLAKKSPWHLATATACGPYSSGPVPNPSLLAANARQLVERTGYAACSVTRIPHPTRPRTLLEALSFAPAVLSEAGPEAAGPVSLRCSSHVCDLGRTEVMVVEAGEFGTVTEHAFARLFERSDFQESDLPALLDTTSLLTTPLLEAHIRSGAQGDIAIAMPFKGGLLLGGARSEILVPGNHWNVYKISARGKHETRQMEGAFFRDGNHGAERGIVVVLETFIGGAELTESQAVLAARLRGFLAGHRDTLSGLRRQQILALNDPASRARFARAPCPVARSDREGLVAELIALFDTAEWRWQAAASSNRASWVRAVGPRPQP